MKRTVKIALTASVVLAAAATTAGLQAQQSAMTFFITSAGSGNGGNLGGLEGADAICQKLATAAGAGCQDLARLPQHHRREIRQRARPHRPRTVAERQGRDHRPHPRRPAQRQEQPHQADRAHRDRPGGQRPRRQAEHARHPHRLVAGRHARSAAARRTRPAATGPARTPVRRSSATTTARASTPRRRRCRGIRRIPRRAAASRRWSRPAATASSTASRRTQSNRRLCSRSWPGLTRRSISSSRSMQADPATVGVDVDDSGARATAPARTPWRSAPRSRAWSRRSAPPPCRSPGPARS